MLPLKDKDKLQFEMTYDIGITWLDELNKESLETNSCEKDREPDNEDESQSIDLSVSPMKGRENVQPVEIFEEQDANVTSTRGLMSQA